MPPAGIFGLGRWRNNRHPMRQSPGAAQKVAASSSAVIGIPACTAKAGWLINLKIVLERFGESLNRGVP